QGRYTALDCDVRGTFHKIVLPFNEQDESCQQNDIRQMTHSPLKLRLLSLYTRRRTKTPAFHMKSGCHHSFFLFNKERHHNEQHKRNQRNTAANDVIYACERPFETERF